MASPARKRSARHAASEMAGNGEEGERRLWHPCGYVGDPRFMSEARSELDLTESYLMSLLHEFGGTSAI